MKPRNLILLCYGIPLVFIYLLVIIITIRIRRQMSSTFVMIFVSTGVAVRLNHDRIGTSLVESHDVFSLVGGREAEG